MPHARVLVIGFSVTEMNNSYVPRAQAICEEVGLPLEFHKCGIGGIGVETLAYLIDDILDMHRSFDRVVFELATGNGRLEFMQSSRGLYDLTPMRCIEQICAAARSRGVHCAFLNLPRLDVDYRSDIIELAIFVVAARWRAPVCSVTYDALLGEIDLASMLPDKVHVNETGADHYARNLIELAQRYPGPISPEERGPRRFVAKAFSPSGGPGVKSFFERHGFSAPLMEVKANEKLKWRSPHTVQFSGITFLSGPISGKFRILVDGQQIGEFNSFDQYCYYERFNSILFPPVRGGELEIEVLPDIPDEKLLKGRNNTDSRVMYFSQILFQPLAAA